MSMKNSNDTIGNRTRDLPACSAVPQTTAPPRALRVKGLEIKIMDQVTKASVMQGSKKGPTEEMSTQHQKTKITKTWLGSN
jgi:hypothetical protein